MTAPDLTGQRFGRLVVQRAAGTHRGRTAFFCRCDCGIEKVVTRQSLIRIERATRSCGCARIVPSPRRVDHTHQVFGLLFIEGRAADGYKWKCRCACGRALRLHSSSFLSGGRWCCALDRHEPARLRAPGPVFLPSQIRTELERRIIRALDRRGVMTRAEIARAVGRRSDSGICDVLRDLRRKRLIRIFDAAVTGRGGSPETYIAAPRGFAALACIEALGPVKLPATTRGRRAA